MPNNAKSIIKKIAGVFLIISLPVISAHALTGKEVYTQTCIACHGANGQGAIPGAANFTLENGPLSKPDKVLLDHIINGYQTPGSPMAMPARGGNPKLTDDDIKNALQYIRDTFGKKKS